MKGETYQEKGYLTNIITDKAIDWLENKRDKTNPSSCSYTTRPATATGCQN